MKPIGVYSVNIDVCVYESVREQTFNAYHDMCAVLSAIDGIFRMFANDFLLLKWNNFDGQRTKVTAKNRENVKTNEKIYDFVFSICS